ncbi:MAG: hypothetical protein JNL74_01600, partial [Fibrobacteres bacterium]|nr:hypothetical protein [Fibrobacterota bacterium]
RPTLQEKYVGSTVCAVCHTSIGAWWKESKHAIAYEAVAKKYFARSGFRREYADRVPPNVLEKSTTGYGVATGYDPAIHQKNLLGVHCEACHTAGGPHDGKTTRDMQSTCTKCHTSADDPTFEYRSALRKLAHPKVRN